LVKGDTAMKRLSKYLMVGVLLAFLIGSAASGADDTSENKAKSTGREMWETFKKDMKEVKSTFKELGKEAKEEGKKAGKEAKRNLKEAKEAFKPHKSK
jgi:gas vesicle protein